MTPATQIDDAVAFLEGGGENGALMRAIDWAATPLGPAASWPQSLKTCVRIMLTSRQPMFVWWGDQLINLYNDAYRTIVGGKHPWALGQPAKTVWHEIWDQIRPRAESALHGNEGTYDEALLLLMERNGYPEETYYTFSYSPVPNDQGGIGGIICANTDDTRRIIGERQLALLRDLASSTADARTVEEVCRRAERSLAGDGRDLPFALLYRIEQDRRHVTLAGASGIVPGAPAAPLVAALDEPAPWPFAEIVEAGEIRTIAVDALGDWRVALPRGPWEIAPRQVALLPIVPLGQAGDAAVLVAGLNPFRLFDDDYRGFLGLVASQIGAAMANARAYEEERRRAEALAEIDRAKTAFFSNASHEFRTPLTLMLSPLEDLLVRHPTVGALLTERRDIELIHRNGLRLLKLVNTLLDFSRIEAGRVQASFEPVDLAALTAELASSFRSAMERSGLTYTVDCQRLPETAYVDRDMWEKIVLNLVSNAFKYTLAGSVTVALRAAEDGKTAQLVVRDTGVGVPAAEVPRLFERFHRVEAQRGRTHEGSGIGLALVQELLRLHGGTVAVESCEGRGSTFTVTLPLGKDHLPGDRIGAARTLSSTAVGAAPFVEEALRWLPGEASPAPSIERELIEPALETTSGHAHVLLADDNADMRDYLKNLLATRYEVETVADGEAALAAARRRRPDLVLSDVMMPRLDGFGLLKALRADPELLEVPVILLSARAGDEAKVEGLEAGADDYLTKPFGARELLARVSTNLELSRARQQASAVLREEARRLTILNRTGAALAAELELDRLVQMVTDAAVELTGAKFGAFFYNVTDENGESYTLYALSGAPREAFAGFPMPRNSSIFEPTFRGEGVVRSADIQRDPRYGKNPPYNGMPSGHLPVRSYLALPVVSRSGQVHGGLFFGHPDPGVFSERDELIMLGIAAQAAIAIDNAQLLRASRHAEEALRHANELLELRVEQGTRDVHLTSAQLNLSEQRFRLLVQGVTDYAIFMLDENGFVSSWNAGAERIEGYAPDEIIGQHFSRFYAEEDRQRDLPGKALRQAMQEGHFEGEGWRVRKDGRRFWASVVIDAIRDHGKVVGFAKVTRDLTEKRQMEEQLRHAQKMEAIGQLTGGVAHDFNNLLQVVLGNLDTLRRRLAGGKMPSPEDLQRLLQAAISGGERGAILTQRLLAFSRRQPLNPKPLEVNRLVAGMSDLLHRTLGEAITIETVLAGGLWQVSADANQLESTLLNLAVNARDAMPGGGKLTIETANSVLDEAYATRHGDVASGQYVMIAVSDTGIGMTKEVIDKAFEPFFTTKEVGHGTGLGLSQVYGFLKQSGGHVKIYSEPGEGSTIKLYLPRIITAEPLGDAVSGRQTAPAGSKSEIILVVEDDEAVRAYTEDMLRELGYTVLSAANGAAALRRLADEPDVALLFTDVGLPGGMNGRELADEAKRRHPGLKILFTTGYARNAIVHHGRLDPGLEMIGKPFTFTALALKIREVLGG